MFLTSKSALLLSVLTHSNTSPSRQCSWYSRVWPSHQWLNADAAISVTTGGITHSTCRTVFKSPGCLDPLCLQNPDKPTQTAKPLNSGTLSYKKKKGLFPPKPNNCISEYFRSHCFSQRLQGHPNHRLYMRRLWEGKQIFNKVLEPDPNYLHSPIDLHWRKDKSHI